ncbi:DciA family protein [Desulfonatronum parangueonense]
MAYQASEILHGIWSDPDCRRRLRLARLWSSWSEIVGDHVAELAKPLGHNKTTLLLGVDDPMAMQEMHFQTPAILAAVNAALGEKYFDKVRLDLLNGRSPLDAIEQMLVRGREAGSRTPRQVLESAALDAGELGHDAGRFSTVPALERCYRAYVRLVEGTRAQKKINQ